MIFVKRIRRQCGMRGCRNTDTYSVSRFNESAAGNIIICKDCLKEALKAVENCTMPAVDYNVKKQSAPPPLFHNTVVPALQAGANVKEENREASSEPEKTGSRKRTNGSAAKSK